MIVVKVILAVLGMMIFWGGFYSLTQVHQNDEINKKIDKITMAVGAVLEIIVLIWLLV